MLLSMPENHLSDELLLLDDDTKAVSLKCIQDIYGALKYLNDSIKTDTCTKGTRFNGLGSAQGYFEQLMKSLNYQEDIDQNNELKKNLLREANSEIYRLRKEMANGVTLEAIGNKLYVAGQNIYHWWQNLGFTYCKHTCGSYGDGGYFNVEFSINIEKHISSYSQKPVTDKANLKLKQDALLKQLDVFNEGSDIYLIDNEKNRDWITNKLEERFPGIYISSWESRSIRNSNKSRLQYVKANIKFNSIGEKVEELESDEND